MTSKTPLLVRITVNGQERLLTAGTPVGALLDGTDAQGSAIARNHEVVPRSQWDSVLLAEGDTIELVRPTQGG